MVGLIDLKVYCLVLKKIDFEGVIGCILFVNDGLLKSGMLMLY